IERYPIVVTFGGALLGWIAGGMMIGDPVVVGWLGEPTTTTKLIAEVVGALIVIGWGKLISARQQQASRAA
ncbi:MAG TPA: TerC family protein, partial [Burkholderiaceae bacterium]|nr:TerC family protein [Burkholderiaceae bacterium]